MIFRALLFLSIDVLLVFLCLKGTGFLLNSNISERNIIYIICLKIFLFYLFKLYNLISKYVSLKDLLFVFYSVICSAFFMYIFKLASLRLIIIDALLCYFFISFSRLFPKVLYFISKRKKYIKKVLIYGAGDAGDMISKEIIKHPEAGIKIIGFIDDDKRKKNKYIHNYKVFGGNEKISSIIRKYGVDEIIIALPSATSDKIQSIYNELLKFDISIKVLPAESELVDGTVSLKDTRDFDVNDVLRKTPHTRDLNGLNKLINGKKILITGAGGSIGSELTRQIISFSPAHLILIGHGENSLFQLERKIKNDFSDYSLVVADIQNRKKMEKIIFSYKPDIVFHAAAHKHVNLMEKNIDEAIRNNIMGSYNIFDISGKSGVKKVILISTDKAVNPESIMGMTKRVAEKIMVCINNKYVNTSYSSVRFGNVIGSRGSVIPIFKEQIRNGGPVTVTHKDVDRFFMSIPEAVQLTMEAAVIGKGGEVFILDMGKPVKILDIAEKMIKMAGLVPYEDIDIEFTGLLSGEKMSEVLFYDFEKKERTSNSKIYIADHIDVSGEFLKVIDVFKEKIDNENSDNFRNILKEYI